MANLDNSWQASVIKLAQTGNSRAIAFWLNRYLVPQGVCAQVTSEQTGSLVIRVVCRQVPDCERLVRFICHRLCKLDSETIQQVQISAQMVGASEVLWQKSARIIPASQRQSQPPTGNVYAFPQPVQPSTSTPTHPAVKQPPAETKAETQSVEKPLAEKDLAAINAAINKVAAMQPKPRPVARQVSRQANRQAVSPKNWMQFSRAWQTRFRRKLNDLQTASLDLTDRSIHWMSHQKPPMRALMLGGSAVTAFLIGCSFELIGYYTDPTAFQQSKATLTKFLRPTSNHSGSVQIASERIPVIRQAVLNPDDPTVSLLFSNSDTLTRLSANQLNIAPAPEQPVPLVTKIESYRVADMVVTNLGNSLSSTSPTEAKTQSDRLKTLSDSSENAATASTLDGEITFDGEIKNDAATPEDDLESNDPNLDSSEATSEATDTNEATVAEEVGQEEIESESDDSSEKKKSPLMPQELLANGVDVVNLSDTVVSEGATQLTQTLELLQQNGIHAVGAGQNLPEARRPQIFDVKGQRIAYLGYSDSSPHAVSATAAGVNVGINKQMEEDIKAIRDQVDWVVVNFNWNRELRAYPEEWQISLAHAAIDHGADLIVGYHPTVTQGAEIYNGRAIVYSLGNSIDEYSEKPIGNYETAALKVTLKEHMMELEFLPIQVKKGQAEVAKGELGTTILQYLEQTSSLFDHPLRSPTSLNSQVRLSLPSAPDSEMPTDPFISYPESPTQGPSKPIVSP